MQSELAATKGKLEAARLDSEISKDMEKMEEVRARLEELSQSQIALSTSSRNARIGSKNDGV